MVMQGKIIVNYRYSQRIKEVDLNNIYGNNILFSFNEYEPISIKLEGCVNNIISIECLNYIDLEKENYCTCDANELILENDKEYLISDNNEDIGYRPGNYVVTIHSNSEKSIYYFRVNLNHELSNEGMENIIENINDYINGLPIDFFGSSLVNMMFKNDNVPDLLIFEILTIMEKKIKLHCDNVSSKIKISVQSEIKLEKIMKKQNFKTIRKNILNKNSGVYNYCKVKAHNSLENILLKKYLNGILSILRKFKKDLLNIIVSKEKNLNELKEKYSMAEQNSENQKVKDVILQYKNQMRSLNDQIENNIKWIDKLTKWNKAYNTTFNYIRKLYLMDELSDLNSNLQLIPTSEFLRDPNYNFFKLLYDRLNSKIKYKTINGEEKYFTVKKSYDLFEIYGFIIIQSILNELAFRYVSSNIENFYDFESGANFEYEKDNYKIKIQYDYYCETYYNNKETDVLVNINSRNCKPDYILKIYNNDEILGIIIIEMKYRHLRNLVEEISVTETDKTLSDYTQLGYINKKNERIYVDKKTVLIYPSKNEICFSRFDGIFIGINAEKKFNESVGFNNLKNILYEYLEK